MKISVIIPAYNEENIIAETIDAVRAHSGHAVAEIIVVDGGSSDQTVDLVKQTSAEVLISPQKGRGAQMNAGAEQAEAEILYFLHADSRPPVNFDQSIIKAVSSGTPAGCFRLSFDDDHWLLRSYAWFTRFDCDAFRFGDQSLFITRTAFQKIDGFRKDHIVMEDNEIVRRIKSQYAFTILDDAVVTSARSYHKVGIVKLQLIFVLIYTLYFLGVEQETLVQIKKSALGNS